MKIGVISHGETPVLAALYGDAWVSIPKALQALGQEPINELSQFIARYCDGIPALNGAIGRLVNTGEAAACTFPTAGVKLLPPLPASPKLFTARGNSACFTRVGKSPVCKQPVMEQRFNFNLVGHDSVWTIRDGYAAGGWNYEMVCVMGKPCHGVAEKDAYDYVFGYTNMLDHSGRYMDFPYSSGNKWGMPDEEKVFADWAYEGCFNGNTQVPTPVGPYIVTKDEVGDPHGQMIEERESGRLVTLGSAAAVCFTFNEMIAYMSSFLTLGPGDMMSSASITYDGFPSWPDKYPDHAYIQGTAEKLGTLRLRIHDARKEV